MKSSLAHHQKLTLRISDYVAGFSLSSSKLLDFHKKLFGEIMSATLNKKRPFLWRELIVLGVILLLIVRTIWFFPRTNWSIKDIRRTGTVGKNVRRRDITVEDVRHIVLISIDTCRADHLGCYGYSRKTSPNIDTLAAESVLFNHAVAPVPITLPSHSSMLTGTIPPYHKVRDNSSYRLAAANVTLAEILKDNGFVTGAIIGAFVLDSQFGLDQGFDTYNDNLLKKQMSKLFHFANECRAEDVTYAANTWLEKHRDDKFFLFLHYFDPHFPYEPHERFSFKTYPFFTSTTKDLYDGEVAYTDHCIGQVIKKLKNLGLYDSTMIVLTSDHGEGLGEHSELSHAYFIYHSTLHVPLIIKMPRWPEGEIIDNVVGIIDIVPTVCGALGIPAPPSVQGRDVSVLLSNSSGIIEERYLFCESLYPTKYDLGPFFGIVSNCWKYIHTSYPELYDLVEDPQETENLLNHQLQQTKIMQEQLGLILQNSSRNTFADSKMTLDEETRKRLQSLGYISGRMVDENIQFGQSRQDARKFVEVHNFIERFSDLKLKKKFGKAKRLCQKMLTKWPDMKQLYYYLGQIAVFERDMPAIITHFSQYLERMDSNSDCFDNRIEPKDELAFAHSKLAAALHSTGQIEQAIPHYKKALSYNPYSVETNYNLAGAYLKRGNLDDAVIYYNKTIELDPNFPGARDGLKRAVFLQGKTH